MVERVTTAAALDRLRKLYGRKAGGWALQSLGYQESEGSAARIPLHPPTQQTAMHDQRAAIDWVASWRGHRQLADFVQWEQRQWSLLGAQQVPVRLDIPDPADVAGVVSEMTHWTTLRDRFAALRSGLDNSSEEFFHTMARNADHIVALSEVDFQRLLGVLQWFAGHPVSQLYVRQLPIRGIDTKWITAHNRLVTQLHTANTQRPDLGIAAEPERWRIRLLDESMWLHGLSDIMAPATQLAALDIAPKHVLIVENLISLLTLPPMERTVAIFGQGTAVTGLAQFPWVQQATVYYWGDLDTHGFRILHSARSAGIDTTSLLMDMATLQAFEDLWVSEPRPFRGELGLLTADEQAVFDFLSEHAGTRLEQERIDWSYVLDTLRGQGLLDDRLD